jgi:CRP-like cAMP-binding protein
MSIRASVGYLRQLPLFGACDDVYLQLLAFSSPRMAFKPGEAIIRAGDNDAVAFLIVAGKASVWVSDDNVKKTVATVGPGALAGEMAMIAEIPYPANVTATSDVTAVRLARELFMRVATEYPDFAAQIYRGLEQRLDRSISDLNRVRRLFDGAQSFSGLKSRLAMTGT